MHSLPLTAWKKPWISDRKKKMIEQSQLHFAIIWALCLGDARVVKPQRQRFSRCNLAYVTFDWLHVFVQRRLDLDADLPEIASEGFVELKDEILNFAKNVQGLRSMDANIGGCAGGFLLLLGSTNSPDSTFSLQFDAKNMVPILRCWKTSKHIGKMHIG
jgi:hypothetical protein